MQGCMAGAHHVEDDMRNLCIRHASSTCTKHASTAVPDALLLQVARPGAAASAAAVACDAEHRADKLSRFS
jgi:hypothetical protein